MHSIGLLGTQGDIPNRKLMTREYVLFLKLCSHPFLLQIKPWAHLITFPYSLINIYKTIIPQNSSIHLYFQNSYLEFQRKVRIFKVVYKELGAGKLFFKILEHYNNLFS